MLQQSLKVPQNRLPPTNRNIIDPLPLSLSRYVLFGSGMGAGYARLLPVDSQTPLSDRQLPLLPPLLFSLFPFFLSNIRLRVMQHNIVSSGTLTNHSLPGPITHERLLDEVRLLVSLKTETSGTLHIATDFLNLISKAQWNAMADVFLDVGLGRQKRKISWTKYLYQSIHEARLGNIVSSSLVFVSNLNQQTYAIYSCSAGFTWLDICD